jgi:hypothetical protein
MSSILSLNYFPILPYVAGALSEQDVRVFHPIAGLVMGGRRADVVDVTAEYYIPVYINTYPYNFPE